jgi:hypothetical protein
MIWYGRKTGRLYVVRRLGTQWQVGMSGAVGLRYEAVYPLLDRLFADDWQQAFDDLQVLERAALDAMRDEN